MGIEIKEPSKIYESIFATLFTDYATPFNFSLQFLINNSLFKKYHQHLSLLNKNKRNKF